MTPFVHLHLHSEFSLVDSVVRIDRLIEAAVAAGMPAVALTDQSNMFAAVKFQKAALAAGVQPILGVDLLVEQADDAEAPTRLVLLAQDEAGYLNLTSLVSRSYIEGQHRGEPRIHREWLEGHSAGLIALSGGRFGDVLN
ncbi:MAG: PHP domain-containing protein [Xanthomonadaceae bacterium]|nr:PHP domain-containing protein [Xanthomonadaceae bacterium]